MSQPATRASALSSLKIDVCAEVTPSPPFCKVVLTVRRPAVNRKDAGSIPALAAESTGLLTHNGCREVNRLLEPYPYQHSPTLRGGRSVSYSDRRRFDSCRWLETGDVGSTPTGRWVAQPGRGLVAGRPLLLRSSTLVRMPGLSIRGSGIVARTQHQWQVCGDGLLR